MFTSCSSNQQETGIPIFNGISFDQGDNEKLGSADSTAIAIYEQYFNNDLKAQIPLYRTLKATGYTIYLGIPYKLSLDRFKKARKIQENVEVQIDEDQYYSQRVASEWTLIEYAQSFNGNSLIFVGIAVNQQNIDLSQFTKDALEKRFIIKE